MNMDTGSLGDENNWVPGLSQNKLTRVADSERTEEYIWNQSTDGYHWEITYEDLTAGEYEMKSSRAARGRITSAAISSTAQTVFCKSPPTVTLQSASTTRDRSALPANILTSKFGRFIPTHQEISSALRNWEETRVYRASGPLQEALPAMPKMQIGTSKTHALICPTLATINICSP